MAWHIVPSADYEKSVKDFEKKWPEELRAVASNLKTLFLAVEAGAKVEQLKTLGFVRSEPLGILAITERGCEKKTKPKATRLYVFVDDVKCQICVMLLADKSSQSKDISLCKKYVQDRLAARTKSQQHSNHSNHNYSTTQLLTNAIYKGVTKMKAASKAVSPDEFFDGMFESESDKKALQDHMRRRKLVSTLTALRVAKGLTQADIAAVMGCQQARVSKLEAGVDADLKFSDVEAYAKATKSDVTVMVSDRGKSLAEQIKSHAAYIRTAFLKLVALSHGDDTLAKGVAELHMQAFHNINQFLAETAAKLPVNAENGLPYIQIAAVDEVEDQCDDAPDSPQTAKRSSDNRELALA